MRKLTSSQVAVLAVTLAIGTVNAAGPDEAIRATDLDEIKVTPEITWVSIPIHFYPPTTGVVNSSTPPYSGAGNNSGNPTGQAPRDSKVPCGQPSSSEPFKKHVGNPVILSSGNKVEPEEDFQAAGEMGLVLKRTYNHFWQGAGIFGKYWVSNLDYKITFGAAGLNSCYPRPGGGTCAIGTNTVVYAMRPNGGATKYIKAADGVFYQDVPSPISRIVKETNGSFTLLGATGEVETYTSSGYVTSVRNEYGVGWAFAYENGTFPKRVTHNSGRYIEFTWVNGQMTTARDPAGNNYQYTYSANQFGQGLHRLATSSKPGLPATTVTYHYEHPDATALTGKSINGTRYSTFGYSADGFAISTEHNGQEKHTFGYTTGADGLLTVLETNPLGKKTTYVFKNEKSQTVTGQPSINCPLNMYALIEYNAAGERAMASDFRDTKTSYEYNARSQLTKKVEAFGTPIARTTTYEWDPNLERLASVTVAGVSTTNYTYTTDNRLASETIINKSPNGVLNESRTGTYVYTKHSNGMLATITSDGPLAGIGDAIVATYNTYGDLIETRNGLGHTVTYSEFTGLGQPQRVVNENGAITTLEYDARGRITKNIPSRNGAGQVYSFEYDGFGRLAAKVSPDGNRHIFKYDVQGRLLLEQEPRENGEFSQIVYTYNANSQPVSVKRQIAYSSARQGTVP